jgi:hypothetical protein
MIYSKNQGAKRMWFSSAVFLSTAEEKRMIKIQSIQLILSKYSFLFDFLLAGSVAGWTL